MEEAEKTPWWDRLIIVVVIGLIAMSVYFLSAGNRANHEHEQTIHKAE